MCGITAIIASTFFTVGVAIEPWVRRRVTGIVRRARNLAASARRLGGVQ